MDYYIEGKKVSQATAFQRFMDSHEMVDADEIGAMWFQCLQSEEARDNYLPSDLEIVAR